MKMKTMYKRLVAALLMAAMLTTMLPAALAAGYGDDGHRYTYKDNLDGTTHTATCLDDPRFSKAAEPHEFDPSTGRCTKCLAVNYSAVQISLGRETNVNVPVNGRDASISLGDVRLTIGAVDITNEYELSYNWYYQGALVGSDAAYVLPANVLQKEADYAYVCFVMARPKQSLSAKPITASCTVMVHVRDLIQAQATVGSEDTAFTLGTVNSHTGQSVVDQIYAQVQARTGLMPEKVTFGTKPISRVGDLSVMPNVPYFFQPGVSQQTLDKVTFLPNRGTSGTYAIDFTATTSRGQTVPGTLTIYVNQFLGGMDVVASTTRDVPVRMNSSDFSAFWKQTYPQGALDRVRFPKQPLPTEGSLVYGYQSTGLASVPVRENDEFYAMTSMPPVGYPQVATLDQVTLVPAPRFNGTISLPFVATGRNDRGVATYLNGTLFVVVTEGQIRDVTMNASGPSKLDPRAFLSVYQNATGSRTTNFYIQFLDAPRFGSFYLGYTGQYGDRKLTPAELTAMTLYHDRGTGRCIEDITYVPGTMTTESVRYAAYSYTGELAYIGTVTFTGREISASITTTAKGTSFASSNFEKLLGLTPEQANQTYLTFGRPSSGSLRYSKQGAGTGAEVTMNDKFYLGYNVYNNVSNVYFTPTAGQNFVTIPFTAVTPAGTVNGTLKITVQTGYTKKFTDVREKDWFYREVMDLAEAGIINGMTPTTFEPNSEVTYGQALKLIMMAVGYPDLSTTGNKWAKGFMDKALADGILSKPVDLNRKIDRYTIAEIAAKAMKLKPSTTNKSPFVDMSMKVHAAPYVLALVEAGILNGTTQSNGTVKYYGVNSIRRSEMSAIIWRINNYKK